jgi:AcrR family transcriptional regulator
MSRTYDNHRQNQRDWILQAAEDLFIDRGIDPVTISDIATATRLTRVTIYKYFANKELIAQEIYRTTLRGWRERDEREVWPVPGNGFERLSHFMSNFFTYLVENPREARFVAEFNYLYAREWSAEMIVGILDEILGDTRRFVHDAIADGIADGSIRADLDPDLAVAAVFNFNSALIGRIGEMGTKVEDEYGLSSLAIFEQVWKVFVDGLRPSSAGR